MAKKGALDRRQSPELYFLLGAGVSFGYAVFGAVVMMMLEPETFTSLLQSTHFSIVTIMTIGYGDKAPKTPAGRLFICAYILLWLTVLANAASKFIVAVIEMRPAKTRTIADQKQVILSTFGFLAALLVVGAGAYSLFEGQSLVDGFYWAVITLSTVGYGDITPTHTSSRWFSIIYDFFGVILFAYGLTRVLTAMSEMRVAQRLEVLARQGVTQEMIDNMDRDFSGQIEKLEFVIHVLQDMGRVTESDIAVVLDLFDRMDTDGDGVLDANDFREADGVTIANYRAI